MRRTKNKKLEARSRKLDNVDPIKELRHLKEEELRHAQGGGIGSTSCCGPGPCLDSADSN